MSRALVLVLVAASAAAVWVAGSPARPSCTPGVIEYGGAQARVFCGPGKASEKFKGKTVKFTQGQCDKTSSYFTINLGTIVIGKSTKKKPEYFGLAIGTDAGTTKPVGKDGTYTGGAVTWVHNGVGGPIVNAQTLKVVLKGNRTRGTFTGTVVLGGAGKVTGSFSC